MTSYVITAAAVGEASYGVKVNYDAFFEIYARQEAPKPAKSKTKGIIFSRKPLKFAPTSLRLNDVPLPWVEHAKEISLTIFLMVSAVMQSRNELGILKGM